MAQFSSWVGVLIAAVQAAIHAGKDVYDASVPLRAKNGCVSTAWSFGTDSYPSPWVEEPHRIALLPCRERAHASVRPGPAMAQDAAVAGKA